MTLMKNSIPAIPYAGITQVRFKGYFLSLNRHPLLLQALLLQTPAEIKDISLQGEDRSLLVLQDEV